MRLLLTMDLLSQRIKCDAYFDPYLSPLSISFFRDTVRVTGFSRASFREGGHTHSPCGLPPTPLWGRALENTGLIRFNSLQRRSPRPEVRGGAAYLSIAISVITYYLRLSIARVVPAIPGWALPSITKVIENRDTV